MGLLRTSGPKKLTFKFLTLVRLFPTCEGPGIQVQKLAKGAQRVAAGVGAFLQIVVQRPLLVAVVSFCEHFLHVLFAGLLPLIVKYLGGRQGRQCKLWEDSSSPGRSWAKRKGASLP